MKMDHSPKCKTNSKISRKKKRENLDDLEYDNDFLDKTLKRYP